MVIQHNLTAMNSRRNYSIVGNKVAKSTEKLSSGYRINSAADDAAGLTISEKMRWQIRGLNKADQDIQDGISLIHVAEGALNEVHAVLHRMNELATQAANDTNTKEDREALQKEYNQLIEEIDRIGNDTTFNTMPVFKGDEEIVRNADGSELKLSDIGISSISLSAVDLGKTPFNENSSARTLNLQAVVTDPSSAAFGKTWNLIYGSGNTSKSSFRISYLDDNGNMKQITQDINSLPVSDYNYDSGANEWSRYFNYTGPDGIKTEIKQIIQVNDKDYQISYEFTNRGSRNLENVEYMMHMDTAYNNNDLCEGYFINGNKVTNDTIYTNQAKYGAGKSPYVKSDIPTSISIVDVENALPFSETIKTTGLSAISVGFYNAIDEWSYYDDVNKNLGGSTNRKDLGVSLIFNSGVGLVHNNGWGFSMEYGIKAVESDSNLAGVPVNKNDDVATIHNKTKEWWIQTGATQGNGVKINIDEMNSTVLGVKGVDFDSFESAGYGMQRVQDAIDVVSMQRSSLGAWENRLEYSSKIAQNTAENTQSAESSLRDLDMAKEVMEHSKNTILVQAAQAMISQSNQQKDMVLSLLQ